MENVNRQQIVGFKKTKIDFTDLSCEEHSAFCSLFCMSCDFLVCPICIDKGHQEHDLTEISEAYQEKVKRVKDVKENIQDTIRKLKSIIGNLEQYKFLQKNRLTHEEKQIDDHRNALKNVDDIHIVKLTSDLQLNGSEVFTAIDNDILTMEKVQKGSIAKNNELDDLINTPNSQKFFRDISKLKTFHEFIVPQTTSLFMSVPTFVPGDITLSKVGELQANSCGTRINLQIIEHYQTELSAISHLCTSSTGSLWMGSNIDDTIHEVIPTNGKLEIKCSFNTPVYSMACDPSNNLIISTSETKPQKINATTNGVSDTNYDISPFDVTAIHITRECKVVVGGINDELGRRAMFIINMEGRQESKFELDKNGKPLFTYPYEITSTDKGHIHAVDCHPSQDRGRVVVLLDGGDIRNIYSGHPDVNKDTPFIPASIATTLKDNVVVVDHFTWYLHVLDNEGHPLTVYNTKDAGIQLPESLSFISKGSLWIGCSTPEDSDAKAKVYHVNISEY